MDNFMCIEDLSKSENTSQVYKMYSEFRFCHVPNIAAHSNVSSPEFFCKEHGPDSWTPLLLMIPLRLGLNECNNIYIDGIKVKLLFAASSTVDHFTLLEHFNICISHFSAVLR